ncbi:hypothetical protein GGX14DRAFT_575687 [Mycena pura]|uniref:Uncharacterized protein n=1 Tax=Mycena pura TaxID=153505 RepID=A0AAD6UUS3_9AGAR|nr:hypothetical protein GGX14DRAFT_575687 [Mycena pura]
MDGLVNHKFRFISNVADGAAVERDCQARVATACKKTIFRIEAPLHLNQPAITVPLYDYKGNVFINTQDAPHARKTGRNNFFSGARALVVGDFVAHYKQLYNMAMCVDDPTMYPRDAVRADKQDDNAAVRVYAAATLKKLTEDVEENMGIIVLIFVIGNLVDAYESRTMDHTTRAKNAILGRLFFKTWKLFLCKMGYSLSRYYISNAADKIFDILIDGLLGLIVVHRDCLGKPDIPLLPWKHESMGNERIFAAPSTGKTGKTAVLGQEGSLVFCIFDKMGKMENVFGKTNPILRRTFMLCFKIQKDVLGQSKKSGKDRICGGECAAGNVRQGMGPGRERERRAGARARGDDCGAGEEDVWLGPGPGIDRDGRSADEHRVAAHSPPQLRAAVHCDAWEENVRWETGTGAPHSYPSCARSYPSCARSGASWCRLWRHPQRAGGEHAAEAGDSTKSCGAAVPGPRTPVRSD